MGTGIRDLVRGSRGAVGAPSLVPLEQERLGLEDTGPVEQTFLLHIYAHEYMRKRAVRKVRCDYRVATYETIVFKCNINRT